MIRTVKIEIAGVVYPLRRSLLVDEWMFETYGGMVELFAALRDVKTMHRTMIELLAKLMNQGVAHERRFSDGEQDIPDALAVEELQYMLTDDDLPKIMQAITEAFDLAKKNEVEGKPVSQKGKKKASP